MNTGIGLVVSGEKLMFLFIDGTIYSLVKQSAWTSFYAILPKNTVFDHLFLLLCYLTYLLYIIYCLMWISWYGSSWHKMVLTGETSELIVLDLCTPNRIMFWATVLCHFNDLHEFNQKWELFTLTVFLHISEHD